MPRTPSFYLHFGFFLHLCAFSALLAGYCTPYWTMVKLSTGDVKALGVVVSCHRRGCDLLHVTGARMVFIIIFGMCTGAVVLSFFILQCFCLAIYNGSCMVKNLGAGLSYLSVVIACTLGATLTLYQIDLEEENKPGVMWMSIGWSRYAVIGSAGGYLLGAFCNVADFTRRNRLNKLDVVKKAEARNKMISMMEKSRQAGQKGGNPGAKTLADVRREGGGGNAGSGFKGKKMSLTVDAAMQVAAQNKNLENSLKSSKSGTGTAKKSGVILVNEASEKFRGRSVNTVSRSENAGRTDQGQRGARAQPQDDSHRQMTMDVAKKSKLTKVGHVDSTDGRPVLPSVEEEKESERSPHKSNPLRDRSKVSMKGHDARLLVSDNQKTSQRNSTSNSGKSGVDPSRDKLSSVDPEAIDSAVKYMVTSELNKSDRRSKQSKSDNSKHPQSSSLLQPNSSGRRGSAVEDAIANISSFLGNIKEPGQTGNLQTSDSQSPGVPSPLTRRNADRLSLRSETSVDGSSERPRELPPISHRRKLTTEDSVDFVRSSSFKRQVTVDSEKTEMTGRGYENSKMFLRDIENLNKNKEDSVRPRDRENDRCDRRKETDMFSEDREKGKSSKGKEMSSSHRDEEKYSRDRDRDRPSDDRDRKTASYRNDALKTSFEDKSLRSYEKNSNEIRLDEKDKENSHRNASLKTKSGERSVDTIGESSKDSCEDKSSSPQRNPLETQLTEEQIKRQQIVESIARNRESKEKRRKRITQ